jgi:hypothetical protein
MDGTHNAKVVCGKAVVGLDSRFLVEKRWHGQFVRAPTILLVGGISRQLAELLCAELEWPGIFSLICKIDSIARDYSEGRFFQLLFVSSSVIPCQTAEVFERDLIPIDFSITNSICNAGWLVRRVDHLHTTKQTSTDGLELEIILLRLRWLALGGP